MYSYKTFDSYLHCAEGGPSSGSESRLWDMFVKELSLTADQEEKLSQQYKASESSAFRGERRKLAVSVSYLDKLRSSMAGRTAAVKINAEMLQKILTPEQVR